jgi:hypothetical protein
MAESVPAGIQVASLKTIPAFPKKNDYLYKFVNLLQYY